MRTPLTIATAALLAAASLAMLSGCQAATPPPAPITTQHITGLGLDISLTNEKPVQSFVGKSKVTPVRVVVRNTTSQDIGFLGGPPSFDSPKHVELARCIGDAENFYRPAPDDIAAHATARFTLILATGAAHYACSFVIGKFADPRLNVPLTIGK